jgi:phosphoribosylpyrophosphate synthetase
MTECERLENDTHATLRIMGDALDPEEVTRLLAIAPTFARRKGDKYGKSDRPVTSRTGVWALESEGFVATSELEQHLEFLIGTVGPAAATVLKTLRQQGFVVDILCYWMSGTGQGGPVLSPEILSGVAHLGATLNFDFYSAV